MQALFPPVFSDKDREHILNNKYVPGSKSLIMPYMNYWWEFIVQFVSPSIAPNVLTLVGFLVFCSSFYLYCYVEPHFAGTYDSAWFYLFQCLCLFVYSTLDSIDGKHARITQNSSPMGQLFDHGLDAIVGTLVASNFIGIVGFGTNWMALYVLIMTQIIFYSLNWRARHVGKFDFGSISVDETMVLCMCVYIVTAFKGPSIWHGLHVFGVELLHILLVGLSLIIVYRCWDSLTAVNKHYGNASSFGNGRLYELANVVLFHLSLIAWNLVGAFNEHPVLFISTVAFAFAHLIHQLIIHEVTKREPAQKIHKIVIPFVMVALLSVQEYVRGDLHCDCTEKMISMKSYQVMLAMFCYSIGTMMVYGIRCMLDLKQTLKLNIFTINPPKKKNE